MTNPEIEKLAIDSFNNYNNGKFDDEFFDKKEAYHYGYNDGYLKGVEKAIEISNNYLAKYSVDIFRPYDIYTETVSIDRVSAQMARHILILVRKELEQLLSSAGEE